MLLTQQKIENILIRQAKTLIFALCGATLLLLAAPLWSADAGASGDLVERIALLHQRRFEVTRDRTVANSELAFKTISRFYRSRAFQPVWIGPQGVLPEADTLVDALGQAETQGLDPRDYRIGQIVGRLSALSDNQLAELDLLLSEAFVRYCTDVRSGRAEPRNADPDWFLSADRIDHLAVLEATLENRNLEQVLGNLLPSRDEYRRLRRALAGYRQLVAEGGWPVLSAKETLRQGMRGPAVLALKGRLEVSGDFTAAADDQPLFSSRLEEAVRHFQARHGLEVDGVVGPKTRAALNVPVSRRITQLVLNLERLRWMPRDLPDRHLLVNMAGFYLKAIEDQRAVLQMRVIVGRAYRSTPAFTQNMTYLVLNPYWNIPTSIAVEDMLPKILKNPQFLDREGIRVFSGWGSRAEEHSPRSIDWSQLSAERFPYRLRQDPGPKNSLGRIKFMLPNRFAVYLHDTPRKGLFKRPVRTFSSGCIRLEKPLELAVFALKDVRGWSRRRIEAEIASGRHGRVGLAKPLPVYLVYWTAWVDEDGTVQFRDDIYGRDRLLEQALAKEGGLGV